MVVGMNCMPTCSQVAEHVAIKRIVSHLEREDLEDILLDNGKSTTAFSFVALPQPRADHASLHQENSPAGGISRNFYLTLMYRARMRIDWGLSEACQAH